LQIKECTKKKVSKNWRRGEVVLENTAFIISTLNMTGVDRVLKVCSQGKTKYYNVVFKFSQISTELLSNLESLWAFNTISFKKNGTIVVEYMVRPEETADFYKAISLANISQKKNYNPTVILKFSEAIPEGVKYKLKKAIRSSDRIMWNENQVAIILYNCQNLETVNNRLQKIIEDNLETTNFAVSIC